MMYFCNCKKENPIDYSSKFRVVEVNSDGVCLDCGHYAMYSDKQVHHVEDATKTKQGNFKYDDKTILEVRELIKQGYMNKEIAKMFDMCPSTVSLIKNNKTRI